MTTEEQEYVHPEWDDPCRVHNWKTYISDELREIWDTFTMYQKIVIGLNAQRMADNEVWD